MPTLISAPIVIPAAGNPPKRIEEFAGEWVRYSSPEPGGAECMAVCLPAFAPATVHRDV